MFRIFLMTILLPILVLPLKAAELKSETVRAWDKYLKLADAKVQKEISDPSNKLFQDQLPPKERAKVRRQLESAEIVVRKVEVEDVVPKGDHFKVPDGEIHHWWGAILLRNVELSKLMAFLQDYDHHAGKFADVERSRLVSKNGDYYRFDFRFHRTKAFVTAVYNTEQECRYTRLGPDTIFSRSEATRIAEVEDPGKATEREKNPGNDNGYLWRLVSWWRFEQKGKDVAIEIESASLSRDIPWEVNIVPFLKGYIQKTPRESLESVLTSIRTHVK
jgi:hypothetical protein